MPKRTDIKSVLVLGSGPIVIGQGCEFDYSGTQACRVLRREGYRVVLVNSNPATIMTDPEFADATYIEPLDRDTVAAIIAQERPDALLPTVGGQTALNLAVALDEAGVLAKHGIETLGASVRSVRLGEDRLLFKQAMQEVGVEVLLSGIAKSIDEARAVAAPFGYPVVIRPSFTLGGTGGGIAFNKDDFDAIVRRGLTLSPVHEILIEESVLGWKEFELEVMRDAADTFVVVCSIENLDPMGVHTGDSITVAPQMTLSAGLPSKATGLPIAKIAALLAVGYRLDEIPNDITKKTPAAFEPTLDYVVVKIPRFTFEKFPGADTTLGVQMKSVGEVMALGRTFAESFGKAVRSLETGRTGWIDAPSASPPAPPKADALRVPRPDRIFAVLAALRGGTPVATVADVTGIAPWFLDRFQEVIAVEREVRAAGRRALGEADLLRRAQRSGFSDPDVALLTGSAVADVRAARTRHGVTPVFNRVDTCAAEFESRTPYLYSCYETEDEADPSDREKVIVLGSGPNRIGQGLEFDYCCVHAAEAITQAGYESVMINCNPETVSTDYDTSDRLYFEPLTLEDVLAVVEREKPKGLLVQFGGQTPLKLAKALEAAGVPILGTSPDAIDRAEDRERFGELLRDVNLQAPPWGVARDVAEGLKVGRRLGFPLLVRPSYVLGGRAMRIAYDEDTLEAVLEEAIAAFPDRPVLIDRFLEDAYELDVDALGDGEHVVVAGVMQHIEEAGIHSGDSYAVLPPYRRVPRAALGEIRQATAKLGQGLEGVGLMNVQFAIRGGELFVLEVNPRASRTVPFVAKSTGVPFARLAARLCLGETLPGIGLTEEPPVLGFSIKAPVFPFRRFEGVDTILGPEMRSTGEVMGRDRSFGLAFLKAALGAGIRLPEKGNAFLSVHDGDKDALLPLARELDSLGFRLLATAGTAKALARGGLTAKTVLKVNEGRPNIVDLLINGSVDLIVNTPLGRESFYDEVSIRRTALDRDVPCLTTPAAASAAREAIRARAAGALTYAPLQEEVRV